MVCSRYWRCSRPGDLPEGASSPFWRFSSSGFFLCFVSCCLCLGIRLRGGISTQGAKFVSAVRLCIVGGKNCGPGFRTAEILSGLLVDLRIRVLLHCDFRFRLSVG